MKQIFVVGLGYVGLPTAIFFAEMGFNIVGVSIEEEKIAMINNGISPIGELNLDSRLSKVINNGKLVALHPIWRMRPVGLMLFS